MLEHRKDSPIIPIDTLMKEIREEVASRQSSIPSKNLKTEIWHDFSSKGDIHSLLDAGWSPPEKSYCWMIGNKAQLTIPLSEIWSSLRFSILAHPMLGNTLSHQLIQVFWNSKHVAEWRITHENHYSALILNKATTTNLNTIEFRCDRPLSPKECGENDDGRLLAFAVHKMLIKPL